jgi:hypothetical protein
MKEIGNFTFISSALYDPITDGKFKGRRHHEIIKAMQEEGYPSHIVKRCIQGFIVKHSDYKEEYFISRDEATEIAKDNDYPMIGSILTSEDLD